LGPRSAVPKFADQSVVRQGRLATEVRIAGARIEDARLQEAVVVDPEEDLQRGRSGLRRPDVNARDARQRFRNPMERELMQ
jgi:hypothetical protein